MCRLFMICVDMRKSYIVNIYYKLLSELLYSSHIPSKRIAVNRNTGSLHKLQLQIIHK